MGKVRLLIVRHGETDCNVQGIIQGQLDTDLNDVGRRQAEFVGSALSVEKIDEVYTSPLRRAKDTADAIVRAHPHHSTKRIAYWLDDRLKERAFGSLEGKIFDRRNPKRDSMDGIEQMKTLVERLEEFLVDVLTSAAPFPAKENKTGVDSDWIDEPKTRQAEVSASTSSTLPSNSNTSQTNKGGCSRTILLVSHGAAISALVGGLLQDMGLAAIAPGIQRTRVWNCSITEITVDTSKIPLKDGKLNLNELIESGIPPVFLIERWADVRHLPESIDNAGTKKENADEMVGSKTT